MKTAANGGIWSGISQTVVTHVAARPQRPEDDTYMWVRKEINDIINIICLNNSPKNETSLIVFGVQNPEELVLSIHACVRAKRTLWTVKHNLSLLEYVLLVLWLRGLQ